VPARTTAFVFDRPDHPRPHRRRRDHQRPPGVGRSVRHDCDRPGSGPVSRPDVPPPMACGRPCFARNTGRRG
jgi:hypothetical protein